MLTQYVVYENPSDYPGKYVVRRWHLVAGVTKVGREPIAVADSLARARAHVPAEMVNIGRMGGDDPVIYEVWV